MMDAARSVAISIAPRRSRNRVSFALLSAGPSRFQVGFTTCSPHRRVGSRSHDAGHHDHLGASTLERSHLGDLASSPARLAGASSEDGPTGALRASCVLPYRLSLASLATVSRWRLSLASLAGDRNLQETNPWLASLAGNFPPT